MRTEFQITIPVKWNPHNPKGFNQWMSKVFKEVEKSKLKR